MHTQYQGYHKKEKSDFLFFPLWSLILVAVTMEQPCQKHAITNNLLKLIY